VWIDGRDGDTGLRVAASTDGVVWRANANVDAVTCQCCWNDLAVLGPDRLAVLYRDRDPRDMAVAVTEDGARSWERRGTAGAFGWKVDGCPHVGGGLAMFGATLHAVVWTGAPDRAGLYDVASADGGRHWSEPFELGGRGARHGDLAVAGGALVAAWDEGAAIYAARSADGKTWSEPLRLSDATARASHPLVVATASGALVLWTESRAKDGESGGDDGASRWASVRF
ncbi:MAG TPA: exo-alpha-sialidase, partial [Thermoanaerobaculia bacterium]|nr:exo-alpha-sialidase [Thermoanaerobaculia bacterium]